jgi:hypothetical protein
MIHTVEKFLLICSGATIEILEQPECKTELTRYRMIGAFVLMTASFAALSGGFALYTGFKSVLLAIPIGLLWGVFIFTLDRFIVSSIRKKAVTTAASLKETLVNKASEILSALPRLIMAIFIAMTVAVPLELKYFQPEITAQIAKNSRNEATKIPEEIRASMPDIKRLEGEIATMDADEKVLRDKRDSLREQRYDEENGKVGPGFSGIAGDGPLTRQREADYNQVVSDLEQLTQANKVKRDKAIPELERLRTNLEGKIGENNKIQEARVGFLEQLKALHQLADENGPIKNASRFLVILLSLIETAPVLIKLLARRGPYDDLLEAIEHKTAVLKKKEISDFNSEINKELERYDSVSEARWLLEEQLRRSALNLDQIQDLAPTDLRDAQSEIAQETVATWRQKELRDIKGVMNENGLRHASGINL